MFDGMIMDRIQFFSILFSLAVFATIFLLVKHRKVREEYSILWFATAVIFLYLSLDRYAVDRLGNLFGIAYKPTIILLLIAGFITLVLVHITVVITRLTDQNKEIIQELGLTNLNRKLPQVPREIAQKQSDLLVIVPAYNEAENIGGVIADLKSLELDPDILVINDGSSDLTYDAAKATRQALVINLPNNLGIGGAVQTGFKWAKRNGYRFAVQFDGDGQHIAAEIPKLLDALDEQDADMVIGSRFIGKQAGYRSTFTRRLGIRVFMAVNSLLIGQTITDNTSGFRAYGRRAIEFLARHYPVDYPEPEAVILLGKNNFTIAEIPAGMQERQSGGSSIHGFLSIYYMVKVLLAVFMTALRKPIKAVAPLKH
ncbi:MAG: DUF2304 family protein [Desulfuromonadales bacterium]